MHSLSGPSGTGKSTIAIQLAHEFHIEAIIDDGLLIINGEKKAGTSAKFEKNTITAVRCAIFQNEQHKTNIQQALKKYNVRTLLIIGTSDKMTTKIASRLELPKVTHFHYINELRTDKEIQMARFVRGTMGKHLMPIPYKQVEQNFFKRIVHRGFDIFSKNKVKLGETTIVQPDFHRQVVEISKSVYLDFIHYVLRKNKKIGKVDVVQFSMKDFQPMIYISIYLAAPVNYDVIQMMYRLQQDLSEEFKKQFEFEPTFIKIYIRGMI